MGSAPGGDVRTGGCRRAEPELRWRPPFLRSHGRGSRMRCASGADIWNCVPSDVGHGLAVHAHKGGSCHLAPGQPTAGCAGHDPDHDASAASRSSRGSLTVPRWSSPASPGARPATDPGSEEAVVPTLGAPTRGSITSAPASAGAASSRRRTRIVSGGGEPALTVPRQAAASHDRGGAQPREPQHRHFRVGAGRTGGRLRSGALELYGVRSGCGSVTWPHRPVSFRAGLTFRRCLPDSSAPAPSRPPGRSGSRSPLMNLLYGLS